MSNYIVDPFFQFGQPPGAPTRNAWRELGRTVLGGDSSIISVNVPNVRYYMLLSRLFKTNNFADSGYTVNLDGASNYANRASIDGGADFTFAPETKMGDDGFNDNKPIFRVDYLDNNPTNERLLTGHVVQQNTAGPTNPPRRVEAVGKWDNVLDQITSIQVVNDSPTANYIAGSELVVLGFDPSDGLSDSSNFWTELASSGITQASPTQINVVFPAKKYLLIQCWAHRVAGGVRINLRYNNDAGLKYSLRTSSDGGGDVTDTLANDLNVQSGPEVSAYHEHFVINEQAEEKIGIFHSSFIPTLGAGTAPTRNEGVSKFSDTSVQITALKFLDGLGGDWDDAFLKVWGHD